jgi:hypothetical protein
MPDNLVIACYNNHNNKCGDPPQFASDSDDKYFGYFQNEYDEQWIYIYKYDKDKAIIIGGDTGWDNSYSVINGKVPALTLSKEEQKWLKACWEASNRK